MHNAYTAPLANGRWFVRCDACRYFETVSGEHSADRLRERHLAFLHNAPTCHHP